MYNVNDDDEEEEDGDYEVEEEINTSKPKEEQDDNLSSNRSNSVPVYISNEEESKPNNEIKNDIANMEMNSIRFCHRLRKKGTFINIDEVDYFNIKRMKRKKNIFSKIGLVDDDYYPAEFLLFFEEQFIYFIKDVEVDKKNKKIRKVGSHYSFFQISNVQFEEDIDNQTIVRIEMIKLDQTNSYFTKEFFIDTSLVPKLTQYISFYFKALGLETTNETGQQEQS